MYTLKTVYTEGQDYSQVIELVVFEPGEVEKSLEIVITDDREVEKEREAIYLYLTGGDDAALTPFPNTVITITDDDGEPELHADCKQPLTIYVSKLHTRIYQ